MSGQALAAIGCQVLDRLYRTEADSMIAPEHAAALHRLVQRCQPELVIEIGMANGASTLAILRGLERNGRGRLVSIDPYQESGWDGRGLANVEEAGLAHRHDYLGTPDFLALPELLRKGTPIDLAYIDGWHTFDYTLLDFFYLDKMLRVGGLVGFNDCHYPSVGHVLRFVTRHRRYVDVDVGLAVKNVFERRWHLPLARVTGTRRNAADQYFRKLEEWEPDFRFWQEL